MSAAAILLPSSVLRVTSADALAANSAARSVEGELQRLAADYRVDPSRVDSTFGIRVDGRDWTIISNSTGVAVADGRPKVPAIVFVTDASTFRRVAEGDLYSLTALAQAHSIDPTPMTVDFVNGFEFDDAARSAFYSVLFHFFVTDQPKAVRLGPAHARLVHGADAAPIVYDEHLRTSWYGISKGQHINKDLEDQVNDFSSLFIVMKGGTARARLGGKDFPLADGVAIYVPAGMTHEFWNDGDDSAELILIMFGENA